MARKDLLKGLIGGDAGKAARPSPAPRMTKGAIGAVSRSIADLRTRALSDVPADMIDNAGLVDRLDADADLEALAASIRDYGQQVPVLLRHSANAEGRYDIVYGRRRVAACKLLGQPVRAMIRDLEDRDLILAQGQENSARKELTFIEKVNFARQMAVMGYTRKVVCDALHVDKTVISRMLKVADEVPVALIRAIGAAPSVGRERWLALAERVRGREAEAITLAVGDTSDRRFERVFSGLAVKRPAPPVPQTLTGAQGRKLGQVTHTGGRTVLSLDGNEGFDDWLVGRIERIHREFLRERGGAG